MKYLLDTHAFIWWITDNPKLSANIRSTVGDKDNEIFLSTASIWEILIKSKLNKLTLSDNPKEFLRAQIELNFARILNITFEHTLEIYDLPEIHKDPFDRILIAQARTEQMIIITSDIFIKKYDVKTYW